MERRLHIHHTWPLTTSLSLLEDSTLYWCFLFTPFFRLSNRRRTVEFPLETQMGKAKHPESQPPNRKEPASTSRESDFIFLFLFTPYFGSRIGDRTVEFPPRDPNGGKAKQPQSQPLNRKEASKHF